jgi:hypothetical protein
VIAATALGGQLGGADDQVIAIPGVIVAAGDVQPGGLQAGCRRAAGAPRRPAPVLGRITAAELDLELASILSSPGKRLICVQANVMLNDLVTHSDSAGKPGSAATGNPAETGGSRADKQRKS